MKKSNLPTYTQAKNVIWVSYDFASLGYWETSFGEFFEGDFEPPSTLQAELDAWIDQGDSFTASGDHLTLEGWDRLEAFSAQGFELAKKIKLLAGDAYNVVYFDDFKLFAKAPETEVYRLIRWRDL